MMALGLLSVAGCNDSSGNGSSSNGTGGTASVGLDKASALNYNETYSGQTDPAAPEGHEEAVKLADAAFVLWNLQQVQRGIDDTTGIKLMSSSAFETDEAPWDQGFNGDQCEGDAGSFSITSGSAGDESGTVALDDFCFTDGDLTDHEQIIVNGSYSWSDGEYSFSSSGEDINIRLAYVATFEDLEVQWRGKTWTLNGTSATEANSTERAFALDVTDEDGDTFRIQRVIRVDADTTFSEGIWHPDLGMLNFKSTTQDLGVLTGEWAVFGGVCDAKAYLSSGSNDTELTIEVAQKVSGTCEQFNLSGTDALGSSVQEGPYDLLGSW